MAVPDSDNPASKQASAGANGSGATNNARALVEPSPEVSVAASMHLLLLLLTEEGGGWDGMGKETSERTKDKKRGEQFKAILSAKHIFEKPGEFIIACKVQDNLAGETIFSKKIKV